MDGCCAKPRTGDAQRRKRKIAPRHASASERQLPEEAAAAAKSMEDQTGSMAQMVAQFKLADGFRLGFRMGLNPYRFTGFEFGYAYNRTQLHFDGPPVSEQGMAILERLCGEIGSVERERPWPRRR